MLSTVLPVIRGGNDQTDISEILKLLASQINEFNQPKARAITTLLTRINNTRKSGHGLTSRELITAMLDNLSDRKAADSALDLSVLVTI